MNILLTGSSGWLGMTLATRLQQLGHQVVGLDPKPGPFTQCVVSIGWTMFQSIDRVYDASRIERHLGFVCQNDFASALRKLAGE